MLHRFRRLPPMLLLLLLVLAALPLGAFGATGGVTDPDDVALRLDLRTVTHSDDSSTITYTVETYGTFSDAEVDFRWALDLSGDGRSDLGVATQWEDDDRVLVASVEDTRERVVARATVTRPAPDSVRVSFPRSALGPVSAYRYTVIAVTDLDRDGETASGERDIAPDSGFFEHRLGPDASPGANPPASSGAPPATIEPAISPSPATGSAPITSGNPPNSNTGNGAAPAPGPGAQPATVGAAPVPRGTGTSGDSTADTVRSRPTGAASSNPGAGSPLSGAEPSPQGAEPVSSVPRTGPAHEGLATTGAALVLAGVACRVIGRKRPAVAWKGDGTT